MGEVAVELRNIRKVFPGVVALDDMSIQLRRGEVHGLIGENGAGKSTLIKTLTGVNIPEEGEIFVDGKKVQFHKPSDARAMGISCVYQELNIVKELSITDNMFIGNYVKGKGGLLDYKYMNRKAREIMASMEQDVEPTELCGNQGMGQQQMVEIGKSILMDAQVIILDEPTSSLGEKEAAELFRTVNILKDKGIAILFVSHKLEEIFELCDVVTVMRDGKHIITKPSAEMTKDELIAHMVGRSLTNLFPKIETHPGAVALETRGLTRVGEYYNIDFQARRGEILGFSGLVGAGRTELVRGIFAADLPDKGQIFIDGKEAHIRTPRQAIEHKIALLTEDRKLQGLVLEESVEKNLTLVNIDTLKKGFLVDMGRIRKQADDAVKKLQIRTPSVDKAVGELSGGNQQKVVIGKWMNTDAEIYIFDEPTRGIDVGAKIEVYNVMNELVRQDKCVIMISSELPEILGMCDRVIVMREGEKMAEIDRSSVHFNQEDIMKAAWGGKLDEQ
ncbi:sugar ABC transporter ATP-binding protein [Intestinibacillus massiliensis]|uniref:sugar ABC transporter ATP-binding protein n=1 Tax=Intestinibacillus massiliensis TaxID=1871029 RepID=UPI000B34F18D|nr:sugar ABC transporter ATP-binding protein [Intestinibacillus massiliensis]